MFGLKSDQITGFDKIVGLIIVLMVVIEMS